MKQSQELLTLIHDLNECNDVLLARVAHLESTLEQSHKASQQERESAKAAQIQLMERANAQQASAQQLSQHAQQLVANLVDQLEAAQQTSQRQQVVNETLLSELENAKERVAQLEHECALNAQQQAEEAQSRVRAESTIRDLRSRLQRQQRYTLQFKAALEKSLTVTTRSTHPATGAQMNQPVLHAAMQPISAFSAHENESSNGSSNNSVMGGITMPKAQRIVPWAAQSTAPFEGIDPHLESLIRGASQPPPTPSAEQAVLEHPADGLLSDALSTTAAAEANTDSEAESQLWQDLERVIEHRESADRESADKEKTGTAETGQEEASQEDAEEKAGASTQVDTQIDVSAKVQLVANDAEEKDELLLDPTALKSADEVDDADNTPKFNWQPNRQPSPQQISVAAESPDLNEEEVAVTKEVAVTNDEADNADASEQLSTNLPSIVIDPYTVPEGQKPAAEVSFTEPSPWTKAISSDSVEESSPVESSSTEAGESAEAERDEESREPSFLDSIRSGVAPVVNPLRSKKKKSSMASVQLPTFEKAKVSSFQR